MCSSLPFYYILLENKNQRVSVFLSGLKGTARIFLLTKNNFVLADQKTCQVKASVPLPDLASVSVSTQADGFFALKLKEVRKTLQFTSFLVTFSVSSKSDFVKNRFDVFVSLKNGENVLLETVICTKTWCTEKELSLETNSMILFSKKLFPCEVYKKTSCVSGALSFQGNSANAWDEHPHFLPQNMGHCRIIVAVSHVGAVILKYLRLGRCCRQSRYLCRSTFTDITTDHQGAFWESSPFFPELYTSYWTSLIFLTSGVSLGNQRRLLTQQRSSDWDHHQTPPHRGHGCRQGGAQHRHLRRVRPNKAGDFLPPGWCFMCSVLCGRFLVQFKQDKVCVKFIKGASKNGNSVSCKRKNNRLLEVLVPSVA